MSSSRPATPPTLSASCPCSSARSPVAACRRGRSPPMAVYASRDNLTAAKARGVKDVAFHKKRGLAVEDMVKSRWVYRGRDLLPQASLRFGPLHLARPRSLQDLPLVRGGGAQPGAARPPQTGIAPVQTGSSGDGRRTQTSLSACARQTILSTAGAISTRNVTNAR